MTKPAIKPFLKWIGGKTWLWPHIEHLVLPEIKSRKLVELFAGSAAISFASGAKQVMLNDINKYLINMYHYAQQGVSFTDRYFINSEDEYRARRAYFNELKRRFPLPNQTLAALFYYLNRTGYRGMYRVNKDGEFNVPYGNYKKINYLTSLRDYEEPMKWWELSIGEWHNVHLDGTELIFADPPYDKMFAKYDSSTFGLRQQIQLADALASHPGPVIATNNGIATMIALYKTRGFEITLLPARKGVASGRSSQQRMEMIAYKRGSRWAMQLV